MVKINLIAEGRRAATVRRTRTPGTTMDVGQILLLSAIGLGVVVTALLWWFLRGDIKERDRELTVARREVEELAPIIQEVEEFKATRAELQHKIRVIGDLKANQQGPVRVMDMISRAVPELLWLTSLDLSATQIKISGQAFNNNAVAAFTENLDRVPEFQEPVFKETKKEVRQGSEVYSFAIELGYQLVPLAEQPLDPSTTEAAAGGG